MTTSKNDSISWKHNSAIKHGHGWNHPHRIFHGQSSIKIPVFPYCPRVSQLAMFDWRVCQAHHPKKAASFHPIFCRPFKTMPLSDPAWKFLPGGVPSTIINPKKHGMWVKQKIMNHPLLVITIFIYVVWLPFPVMASSFMTLFYPHENGSKKTGITTACSHGIWVCLPASSPWIVCLPVRTARFGLDGIKEIMSKWPAK